ncbi:MAG: helix-turn-helix transcriptional regulator [Oscillospiraceae bacterium]|jgi:transcriptional regulator with XRE-family HTH domain|nr:helix-turn-helix transcriptional regulator [Oscillospiraceae bacterium]
MDIKISENLKRLRITREVTQERLAEYLGVTTQSVSKWERGDNYPDIAQLPAIAAFFDVTVDDLLGTAEFRSAKRVEDALEREHYLNTHDSVGDIHAEILEMWRDIAHELPNNHKAQLQYSYKLEHTNSTEDMLKSAALLEGVLATSTDDETRYTALSRLCIIYGRLGDIDKAKSYAMRLPEAHMSRDWLLELIVEPQLAAYCRQFGEADKIKDALDPAVLEAELIQPHYDAFRAYMLRTWNALTLLRDMKRRLGLEREGEYIELLHMEYQLNAIARLGKANPLDDAPLYYQLALEYVATDADKALECLETYVELFTQKHTTTNVAHVSRYNEETTETRFIDVPMRKLLAESHTQDAAFDPIREHPRFVAAFKRLWDGESEV